MLEKATILLCTHDRSSALQRVLEFWAATGLSYPVRVLDSSSPDFMENNRDTCKKASPRLSVTHHPFCSTIHPFARWQEEMKRVETEYVVFAADDDFLIPSALKACAEFLEAHPDFAVCHGFFLGFLRYETGFWFGQDSFNLGREENSPEERVWKQFHAYSHLTYAMRRSSTWNRLAPQLQKHIADIPSHTGGGGILEMMDTLLSLIAGKAKRLPILHALRNGRPSDEDGWKKSFVFGPDFSDTICTFKKAFVEALSSVTGRAPTEFDELFVIGFNNYFSRVLRQAELPPGWSEKLQPFNLADEHAKLKIVTSELDLNASELPQIVEIIQRFPLDIDFAPAGAKDPGKFPMESAQRTAGDPRYSQPQLFRDHPKFN